MAGCFQFVNGRSAPRAVRVTAMFEDVVLPESKHKHDIQKEESNANDKAASNTPSPTPCPATMGKAKVSETSGYPGFPELLSQSRSSLTGKPIRVVQVCQAMCRQCVDYDHYSQLIKADCFPT